MSNFNRVLTTADEIKLELLLNEGGRFNVAKYFVPF